MAAPLAVTAPSSVQNLMNSSSRRFDGKSRSLDDRDYKRYFYNCNACLVGAPTGIIHHVPSYSKKKVQLRIKSTYHNHMPILALYCHLPKTRVIVYDLSKKEILKIRLEFTVLVISSA